MTRRGPSRLEVAEFPSSEKGDERKMKKQTNRFTEHATSPCTGPCRYTQKNEEVLHDTEARVSRARILYERDTWARVYR